MPQSYNESMPARKPLVALRNINKTFARTHFGLIAQEVKQVMDDMDVEFSGWEVGINTKQRLAYGKFVMPLIKAIQELSARVEELENQ